MNEILLINQKIEVLVINRKWVGYLNDVYGDLE